MEGLGDLGVFLMYREEISREEEIEEGSEEGVNDGIRNRMGGREYTWKSSSSDLGKEGVTKVRFGDRREGP